MTVGLGLVRSAIGQSGTDTVRFTLPGPEYVYIDWIRARNPDGTALSLVHLLASLAVVPTGASPLESDWIDGAWASTPAPDDGRATAYFLLGTPPDPNPHNVAEITDGTYALWSRLIGGVETPIRIVGRLVVSS